MATYSDFVNYDLVDDFRSRLMAELAAATREFPRERGIIVNEFGEWEPEPRSIFDRRKPTYRQVTEGPGNKPWLTEWYYQHTSLARQNWMAWDAGMAAINDLVSSGHMPFLLTDDVTLNNYAWCDDPRRAESFRDGVWALCRDHSMAITGGETASDRFLVKPAEPVEFGPVLCFTVHGVLQDQRKRVDLRNVRPGDQIIGVASGGIAVNGSSSVINYGLTNGFDKPVGPSRETLISAALTPTTSMVRLVSALLNDDMMVAMKWLHGLLPGTGDGLRKLFRVGPYQYVIHNWPVVPDIFRFMQHQAGTPLLECVTTYNWGVGYYIFVPKEAVELVLHLCRINEYDAYHLGEVREGDPVVWLGPENGLQIFPRGKK